jgi:nucleoside-diphosphate-sugar epimerase
MTHPDVYRAYAGVRVALIGAAGFIGRWVSRMLTAAGAHLHTNIRSRSGATVLAAYDVACECVVFDVTDTRRLWDWLSSIRPAVVFNLAGYGVRRLERDEHISWRVNASFISDLCAAVETCCDPGWPGQALIHAGSALEYGAIGGDLSEELAPNPTTLYGRSKLAGSLNLQRECHRLGIHGLTARLFTVYGPGEPCGRLLPLLLEAARTRTHIALTAGTQRRDFTYVEDVAEGLLRLGLCRDVQPGSIVNLASGRLHSVREFVETAARLLDIPRHLLRFGAIPTRPEEMSHGDVNNARLRTLTGWVPYDCIATGISKTMQFERMREVTLT